LVARAIDIVKLYMGRIDYFHPREQLDVQTIPVTFQEDSQDSFDMNLNMDRQVLIFVSLLSPSIDVKIKTLTLKPLCDKILPGLCSLMQKTLTCSLYQDKEPFYMKILVECWARLAGLAMEETFVRILEFFLAHQ